MQGKLKLKWLKEVLLKKKSRADRIINQNHSEKLSIKLKGDIGLFIQIKITRN